MNKEALDFYIDNELNELILDEEQNHMKFKEKPAVNKSVEADLVTTHNEFDARGGPSPDQSLRGHQSVENKKPKFINPIFSTSDALSKLAKKPTNNDSSFTPLNEIVDRAKKVAAEAKTLEELKKAVENFDGCNLKKMATNTVFSDGNSDSEVMIIGEAPGNQEDLQGIPFCDDSGKLLDAMFGAIDMTRENNFYITNVIFWRPPGNRRPTQEELAICRPFVERQIQIIEPKVMVLVGATAMSAVLGINDSISKARGNFNDFAPEFLTKKIKSFTIFHPSYLMRQPTKKKIAWQDMLALEKFLQEN